jgi:hypothetical protein
MEDNPVDGVWNIRKESLAQSVDAFRNVFARLIIQAGAQPP